MSALEVGPSVPDVLDHAIWSALGTNQAHVAVAHGSARRYRHDVARFAAVELVDGRPVEGAWDDMAHLVEPGGFVITTWTAADPPASAPGWTVGQIGIGHQMVLREPDLLHAAIGRLPARPDVVERRLGPDDVPAMLELVALTDPGPFLTGTIELGGYVGSFVDGRLVAMAGERMRPVGHTEISAVCTHPDARGRGLATAAVGRVIAGVHARGETPILHVHNDNTGARALYERLGFEVRRSLTIRADVRDA